MGGESSKPVLMLDFEHAIKLQVHRATVSSDATIFAGNRWLMVWATGGKILFRRSGGVAGPSHIGMGNLGLRERIMSSSKSLTVLAVAITFFAIASSVQAADSVWAGRTGDWNVDANWVFGGKPTAADNALIVKGTAFLRGAATAADVIIGDGNGSTAFLILKGGDLTNSNSYLGGLSGSSGTVTIDVGSQWTNSGTLVVGLLGTGTLTTANGGSVYVGNAAARHDGHGRLIVSDTTNTDGSGTSGELYVQNGSKLNHVGVAYLGYGPGEYGYATVAGSGSQWANSGDLHVGGSGSGTLKVNNGGLVTVGGTTTIGTGGAINISGGRLDFGTMSSDDYTAIAGTSGSLAGDLHISGFNSIAALTPTLNAHAALDTSDVHLVNAGLLYGGGTAQTSLTNASTGQVQVATGERMIFAGGLDNAGSLSNTGGQFFFAGPATNQTGATISGRGTFTANGGWTNDGHMNFSGGFTDIQGDVSITANGSVITTGGAVTTFYGNLINHGTEIRTAPGSHTVIFGLASGAGPFTGTGAVRFEGGFSPGNSPAAVAIGGDALLGASNVTTIQLAGTTPGTNYDVINVVGKMTLDGTLDVVLINGFTPSYGDIFNVINAGLLDGAFTSMNLAPLNGGLSWNVQQTSHLLTLTATPEPSGLAILTFTGLLLLRRRSSETRAA